MLVVAQLFFHSVKTQSMCVRVLCSILCELLCHKHYWRLARQSTNIAFPLTPVYMQHKVLTLHRRIISTSFLLHALKRQLEFIVVGLIQKSAEFLLNYFSTYLFVYRLKKWFNVKKVNFPEFLQQKVTLKNIGDKT